MNIKKTTFFTILLILIILSTTTFAEQTKIYLFYGDGCGHCAHEKEFLKPLDEKYEDLSVEYYEIWYNKENSKKLEELAKSFDITVRGVPVTFINDKVWVGYNEDIGKEIEEKVKECINEGCMDAMDKLNNPSRPQSYTETKEIDPMQQLNTTINIPIIGKIDTTKISLPLFTIMLAGLDSFNPCAFFVLLFLLSMLIYAKSKKRMLLIGGTFIFFSGLIYFIFMAAWLNIFLITGELKIVTTIAGIVALFIAILNIKDYFFFKQGLTLSIPEEAKPTLFQKMRGLLKETSIISMMIGAIVLAITANLYELLCTAGFPMVFTRILTLNELSSWGYYFYLLLYNIIYIIPLLTIVIIFTITLGAKRMKEETGKRLKLLSGMMMLALGSVIIIDPGMMNNILVSIGVIGAALLMTGIVIIITKIIKRYNKALEEAEECKIKTKKEGEENE